MDSDACLACIYQVRSRLSNVAGFERRLIGSSKNVGLASLVRPIQLFHEGFMNEIERLIRREVQRRRTFAIISHPDAGKTTLTEKLLLYGGCSTSLASFGGGSRNGP